MNKAFVHTGFLFSGFDSLGKSLAVIEAEKKAYQVSAIYTKPDIVNFILDVAGYSEDARIFKKRLLEPGCGDCGFLAEIITRLVKSYIRYGGKLENAATELAHCIVAVDIDASVISKCHTSVQITLEQLGLAEIDAATLAEQWLINADFLLYPWNEEFDFVVGNPPYLRIEDVPKAQLTEYRRLFQTSSNRSDIYICFFELGLKLLSAHGRLAFICTNRFVRNRYGAALRSFITSHYSVRYYIDLENTQPFQTDVNAYPAIFVIDRQRGKDTRFVRSNSLERQVLAELRSDLLAPSIRVNSTVSSFSTWYKGDAPWIAVKTEEAALLNLLQDYPVLEQSGAATRVGIGVATGADRVFLVKRGILVEKEVLLPLAVVADIANDKISWNGNLIVNPFAADGSLVDLEQFPLLNAYFRIHEDVLRRRHIAKAAGSRWYKTIDRIRPELLPVKKLLIPDIQTSTVIGYDEGNFYPHHNLYFITSDGWDLRALKTILRSVFVRSQMETISVRMRGGAVRFQSQTLRKLRIPSVESLTVRTVSDLIDLSTSNDTVAVNEVAASAYGFTQRQAGAFATPNQWL